MIVLMLVCFLIVLLLFSWIPILNRQGFNVTGPLPLPLIGNGHLFLVKSTEYLNVLNELSKTFGDAYLVYFFTFPYVVLSHPKFIEPIITSTELITKGRSYNYLQPWLGDGLLTATGQRWKRHRKFLTPAFHFNMLPNFVPVFCKNGRIFMDKLDHLAGEQAVDLVPIVALVALDNVTEAITGVSVDSQTTVNSEYVKSVDTISEILSRRMQVPYLGSDFIFNLTANKNKQDKAIRFLHNHTRNVIATRRNRIKGTNNGSFQDCNDLGIKNKNAFLDILLAAEKEQEVNEEGIREEVDTFLFEGHDTTTSGLCYSIYCISKHPDVQTKILQEQETIFGDDMERDPTFTDLNKMKYLDLVLKESLRLYPSVPLIERKIVRDVEVGELKLRKDATVVINIFQMQRDSRWFNDPLEFRPERFDTSASESVAFSFLAFSAGPRNCIGQKFAMLQMKAILSQLVRRFRVLPVEEEPLLCLDLVLRSKNGVQVKLLSRQQVQ